MLKPEGEVAGSGDGSTRFAQNALHIGKRAYKRSRRRVIFGMTNTQIETDCQVLGSGPQTMIDRLMESWSTPDAASLLRLNFDSVSVGWYLELDVSTPVYFAGSYSDLDSRRCRWIN
jgi:hypothetical protein